MSLSASLLPEVQQEMAKTRTALERVPLEKFGWRPHEKSYSLMELVNHLARLPEWGTATLKHESMDLDPEKSGYEPPPPAETPEGVLALFDKAASEFSAALEASDDENLLAAWSLLNGGEPMFTMPRVAVIRGMILNHMIHHRGQLTVYLRLNDLPVPALYGPSADEGGS